MENNAAAINCSVANVHIGPLRGSFSSLWRMGIYSAVEKLIWGAVASSMSSPCAIRCNSSSRPEIWTNKESAWTMAV
eukprot:6213744-Pleurochrysis_carterae.AAC.6